MSKKNSVYRVVSGLAACLAVGVMLGGIGPSTRQPRRPERPKPPTVVTPRKTPPAQPSTALRIDGISYRVSARATRYIGGALAENQPPNNQVVVSLRLTRTDGRRITTPVTIPTLVCSQGGVAIPIELAYFSQLVIGPGTPHIRDYSGQGNVAWADDVLITGVATFQSSRGPVSARLVLPMTVVPLP